MCREGRRHIGERVRGDATHTPVSELRAGPRPARRLLACVPGAVSWSPFIKPQARLAQRHSALWPHTDLGSSCRLRNESLCVHGSFHGSSCVPPFLS